jgi:hypothetical protein
MLSLPNSFTSPMPHAGALGPPTAQEPFDPGESIDNRNLPPLRPVVRKGPSQNQQGSTCWSYRVGPRIVICQPSSIVEPPRPGMQPTEWNFYGDTSWNDEPRDKPGSGPAWVPTSDDRWIDATRLPSSLQGQASRQIYHSGAGRVWSFAPASTSGFGRFVQALHEGTAGWVNTLASGAVNAWNGLFGGAAKS